MTRAELDAIRAIVREELAAARPATRKPWTPRPTESLRHRELVAQLVASGGVVGGFRRAVEAAVGEVFDGAPKIVPDVYYIEAATKRIGVFEVCVAHWLTGRKLAAVQAWKEWLAERGWSIRLLKVDPEGGLVGIDPGDGELDDDSLRRVADILAGRIEP